MTDLNPIELELEYPGFIKSFTHEFPFSVRLFLWYRRIPDAKENMVRAHDLVRRTLCSIFNELFQINNLKKKHPWWDDEALIETQAVFQLIPVQIKRFYKQCRQKEHKELPVKQYALATAIVLWGEAMRWMLYDGPIGEELAKKLREMPGAHLIPKDAWVLGPNALPPQLWNINE